MTRKKTQLDGRTWARYSISIWSDIEKDREERRFKHPAAFPMALAARLIEIFTVPGDLVLDPFAGTGSTLAAAHKLGRRSVGFEISPRFAALARERFGQDLLTPDGLTGYEPELFLADSRNLNAYLAAGTVALCVTSPPYWNILDRKRTAYRRDPENYGGLAQDLSSITDYSRFIRELGHIFSQVLTVLAPGGYLVVNVMDIRKRSELFPLHMDLTRELSCLGYVLDDIIIWDRRKEYNNLRPLGYPYVFRVNKVHEYLLIFQKRA